MKHRQKKAKKNHAQLNTRHGQQKTLPIHFLDNPNQAKRRDKDTHDA
jgi:hypothetical protein